MNANRPIEDEHPTWLRTLYILFFAQLMVAVGFSSIFPFLPLYVEQLGSSTGLSIEILSGLVYSAQSFTMMLASPIWGTIADRYGRKLMVERSMFGGAVILLIMAFVTSAEQLVVIRAVQGLITGTVAATSALLASVTPRDQKGYAMGLLQVGFGAGLAAGPLLGGAVADAFDYHMVFYLTAALLLLAGVTVMYGVQEPFEPTDDSGGRGGILAGWRQMLAVPGVFVTYAVRFLTSLGRMMITPILPLFILTLLADRTRLNTFTGIALGLASGTTTVSAVFLGRLGDRTGHRQVLVFSVGALAGLYALLGFVTQGWQLLGLQALIGIALGGVVPVTSAMLANYVTQGGEGSAFGLDNSINAGGRALAPLVGAAAAAAWGYPAAFLTTGLIFLGSMVLVVWQLPRDARPTAPQT
jgi:DHA1 family multidrug resistance protein-like MFS transporter